MAAYLLPSADSVTHLLKGLLAADVTVRRQTKPIQFAGPVAVAVYVAEDETPSAFLVCDLAAANYLGAALSLILPAVVTEGIKKQTIDSFALENLREVLNVAVNLFTHPRSRRLRLLDLFVSSKVRPLPGEVHAALRHASARLDLEVNVSRYGRGCVVAAVA
jgi:hypothetical protein